MTARRFSLNNSFGIILLTGRNIDDEFNEGDRIYEISSSGTDI